MDTIIVLSFIAFIAVAGYVYIALKLIETLIIVGIIALPAWVVHLVTKAHYKRKYRKNQLAKV